MAPVLEHYANNTTKLFDKLNTVLYFCGLTDFWVEEVRLPPKFVKIFNVVSIFIEAVMFCFMASEVVAFFTQNDLSPKQAADRIVFGVSHPILYVYCVNLIFYKRDVKEVLHQLAAVLKRLHNDEQVEREMIAKLKFYLTAYVVSCGLCIVFYGASALIQYVRTGATFTTVITAWPDVADESTAAHAARVIFYVLWWIYFSRVSGSYVLILSTFIGLSFQYRNLTTYFFKLDAIFEKPARHSELEREYESALKVGIKLHIDTVWCAQECQKIYSIIFSAQLIMTVTELVAVMSQMMTSERSLVNLCAVGSTACGTIVSAAFLMWNAGDVTVEAELLPAAMYACGWQRAGVGTTARARRLLAPALTLAQAGILAAEE